MPFNWEIKVNRNNNPPPSAKFAPNPLTQVAPGDQIVFVNDDRVAHWPGLLNANGTIDETYFMPNQIAPHSTSDAFAPAADATLQYACSLHPDEKGTIQVQG